VAKRAICARLPFPTTGIEIVSIAVFSSISQRYERSFVREHPMVFLFLQKSLAIPQDFYPFGIQVVIG
jgi:hypothetical protein